MTAETRTPERLYRLGMAAAIALIVLGELAWLPDPLWLPGGAKWIDALNVLLYAVLIPPACWGFAAGMRLRAQRRGAPPLRRQASSFAALLLAAASVLAVALYQPQLERMLLAGVLLGAAWTAAFVDLAAAERARRGRIGGTLTRVGIYAALLGCLFWPTGKLVTYPGLTMDMHRYAQAEGGSAAGRIDGVLIFERPAFPADWLFAKLFPHYVFEPIEELGMPLVEYNELVRAMKLDANAGGIAIAYERLGRGEGIREMGVRVSGIEAFSPAAGAFRAGDVMVQVNGRNVLTMLDLTEAMAGVEPGDHPTVIVERGEERVSVQPGTRAHPDDPTRAVFGILVESVLIPDVPGRVDFRRYIVHEGGPSHGAMLALAIVDQLTPGGVTNGLHVAGTGTIGPNGVIGRVGGVRQKAYTVSRTGADVFFVPAGLEEEARRGAPELTIVPVRTLNDVLNWLKSGE